ncbi:MAG: CpsD/CapB family tyrosine-protein kinase [Oscillospiraceae bacterium]|nr:CpsD/CapB family tyrosine-protein kinase [Oscillospiraceae bacterium]
MAVFDFLRKKEKAAKYVRRSLLSEESHFSVVEAYKKMRTNFLFMLGNDKKVVAFTSTIANEGKTTNCLNLAISFTKVGKKVVVIDVDMRKPQVHNYLDVPLAPGLSDVLGKFVSDVPVKKTAYENLDVIPAGTLPPAPPELLMTREFENLLAYLKEKYDYIFIDTPPVHLVTDLAVFASKIDGVVFVVREKTVPVSVLSKSIEDLENVGGKVLGFILNDSERSTAFSKYSYRRRYADKYGYGYGYGYSQKELKENHKTSVEKMKKAEEKK